jgi:hypothetical protein
MAGHLSPAISKMWAKMIIFINNIAIWWRFIWGINLLQSLAIGMKLIKNNLLQ